MLTKPPHLSLDSSVLMTLEKIKHSLVTVTLECQIIQIIMCVITLVISLEIHEINIQYQSEKSENFLTIRTILVKKQEMQFSSLR